MTTSGIADFDLDIVDLVEEAYERAGIEQKNGYDFRTARRSLNIMAAEWSNRGLNLWTIEEGGISLVPGQKEYALPLDTIDLIEGYINLNNGAGQTTSYQLQRIGVGSYAAISIKEMQMRPTQYFVQRTLAPTVTLWPIPDQAYAFVYWRLVRMDNVGAATNTMDIPSRFIPAMAAGLAYYIAMKRPEAMQRVPMLKQVYDEQWKFAYDEDRDRSSLWIFPYVEGAS